MVIFKLPDDNFHGIMGVQFEILILLRKSWPPNIWFEIVPLFGWDEISVRFLRFSAVQTEEFYFKATPKRNTLPSHIDQLPLFDPQPAAMFKSLAAPTEKCPAAYSDPEQMD